MSSLNERDIKPCHADISCLLLRTGVPYLHQTWTEFPHCLSIMIDHNMKKSMRKTMAHLVLTEILIWRTSPIKHL